MKLMILAAFSANLMVVLLSIVLLGIAFVLLGVKVLFVKGGKFPTEHHAHSIKGSSACMRQEILNQSKTKTK